MRGQEEDTFFSPRGSEQTDVDSEAWEDEDEEILTADGSSVLRKTPRSKRGAPDNTTADPPNGAVDDETDTDSCRIADDDAELSYARLLLLALPAIANEVRAVDRRASFARRRRSFHSSRPHALADTLGAPVARRETQF